MRMKATRVMKRNHHQRIRKTLKNCICWWLKSIIEDATEIGKTARQQKQQQQQQQQRQQQEQQQQQQEWQQQLNLTEKPYHWCDLRQEYRLHWCSPGPQHCPIASSCKRLWNTIQLKFGFFIVICFVIFILLLATVLMFITSPILGKVLHIGFFLPGILRSSSGSR